MTSDQRKEIFHPSRDGRRIVWCVNVASGMQKRLEVVAAPGLQQRGRRDCRTLRRPRLLVLRVQFSPAPRTSGIRYIELRSIYGLELERNF